MHLPIDCTQNTSIVRKKKRSKRKQKSLPLKAKIITLHNVIVSNSFPRLCHNSLHYRIGFELFPRLCNLLCGHKAYHVGIGLHYRVVFKLIYRLCNLFLHYRIGFELIM